MKSMKASSEDSFRVKNLEKFPSFEKSTFRLLNKVVDKWEGIRECFGKCEKLMHDFGKIQIFAVLEDCCNNKQYWVAK